MSDRLNEALSVSEPISEEDELIFAAARAYADLVNGERVEPDFGEAFAELVSRHRCGTAAKPFSIYDARAIVLAAIGDRLLIDPPKEEE